MNLATAAAPSAPSYFRFLMAVVIAFGLFYFVVIRRMTTSRERSAVMPGDARDLEAVVEALATAAAGFQVTEVDTAGSIIRLYKPWSFWGGHRTWMGVRLRQVAAGRMEVTIESTSRQPAEYWGRNGRKVKRVLTSLEETQEYRSRLPSSRPPIGPSAVD
jgi:hypothetical protein